MGCEWHNVYCSSGVNGHATTSGSARCFAASGQRPSARLLVRPRGRRRDRECDARRVTQRRTTRIAIEFRSGDPRDTNQDVSREEGQKQQISLRICPNPLGWNSKTRSHRTSTVCQWTGKSPALDRPYRRRLLRCSSTAASTPGCRSENSPGAPPVIHCPAVFLASGPLGAFRKPSNAVIPCHRGVRPRADKAMFAHHR